MKKIVLLTLLLFTIGSLIAQTKKPVTKPVISKPVGAKPIAAKPANLCKDINDSASCAIGISVANVYKKQGINKLNTAIVSRAINDVMVTKKPLMEDATANNIMSAYMSRIQSGKPAPPPTVTKTAKKPGVLLTCLDDSVNYAIGINVANFYKQFGVTKLNTDLLSKSVKDVTTGNKPLFNDSTINIVMNTYMGRLQEEKAQPYIAAGEKFLAENKLRAGVKTTSTGLQYEVVKEGTGTSPSAADSVTCNYMGTLIDGTEFDNSYKRGSPITFSLTRVISGWTEGLQLMKEGATYKFYVPYQLGYGIYDHQPIPGGSALIFQVDLLQVRKRSP